MSIIKSLLVTSIFIFTLSGCVQDIDDSISNYRQVSHQISLGDSRAEVVPILSAAMKDLGGEYRKGPESYIKDGIKVEIYYARTLRQADGLTTDDEFTPYVFNNGKLVGIGWTSLGGSSSQGQAQSTTTVIIN